MRRSMGGLGKGPNERGGVVRCNPQARRAGAGVGVGILPLGTKQVLPRSRLLLIYTLIREGAGREP